VGRSLYCGRGRSVAVAGGPTPRHKGWLDRVLKSAGREVKKMTLRELIEELQSKPPRLLDHDVFVWYDRGGSEPVRAVSV
jgi:hypothetical protein